VGNSSPRRRRHQAEQPLGEREEVEAERRGDVEVGVEAVLDGHLDGPTGEELLVGAEVEGEAEPDAPATEEKGDRHQARERGGARPPAGHFLSV